MMTFLRLLLLCATLGFAAGPLSAAPVTEQIVAQLSDQGFDQIRVSRTLLGRTRIEATSRDYKREIVVNPATGEILRDYIVRRNRGAGNDPDAPRIVNPYGHDDDDNSGQGSSNSGRDRDDDDYDDDDNDEDDDDDDHSGSGGGGGDDDDDDDDDD